MALESHSSNKQQFTTSVICNITEAKFENNIHLIFTKGCGVDVFGFNSLTGQFWGKKMVKNTRENSVLVTSDFFKDFC